MISAISYFELLYMAVVIRPLCCSAVLTVLRASFGLVVGFHIGTVRHMDFLLVTFMLGIRFSLSYYRRIPLFSGCSAYVLQGLVLFFLDSLSPGFQAGLFSLSSLQLGSVDGAVQLYLSTFKDFFTTDGYIIILLI